jgi:hypothetical protein
LHQQPLQLHKPQRLQLNQQHALALLLVHVALALMRLLSQLLYRQYRLALWPQRCHLARTAP